MGVVGVEVDAGFGQDGADDGGAVGAVFGIRTAVDLCPGGPPFDGIQRRQPHRQLNVRHCRCGGPFATSTCISGHLRTTADVLSRPGGTRWHER